MAGKGACLPCPPRGVEAVKTVKVVKAVPDPSGAAFRMLGNRAACRWVHLGVGG